MSQPELARDLIHVPFRGSEVLAVEIEGKPWIVLRPAFDAIGLDAGRQIDNLRGRHWATTAVTAVVADDGRARDMIVADLRTFLMALATIPVSRVAEHVRPTLMAYQSEVADAIEAYWTRGHAVNPRAGAAAPRLLTLDEASAVLRQTYALPYTVVDLTRAMRAAGITRLSGGPKKAHAQLLWFSDSAWFVVADYIDVLAKLLGAAEHKAQEQLGRGVQLPLEYAVAGSPAISKE
jgi:hypothetical protein